MPVLPNLESLLASYADNPSAEIIRANSPAEAFQVISHFSPCVLLACASSTNEVRAITEVYAKSKDIIKYGLLKSIIYSKLKNNQISQLFLKLGASDVLEDPSPVRTLQFKLNVHVKALATIRKNEELKKKAKEKSVFKNEQEAKNAANAAAIKGDVSSKEAAALGLGKDCFVFRKAELKKSGKKVLVPLEGPNPETGEWNEYKPTPDAKPRWRWVPSDQDAEENKDPDTGWVHEGDKPTFDRKADKWMMASEKPDLSHYRGGKKEASKVATDKDGKVEIAQDSETALKAREKFIAQKEDIKKGLFGKKNLNPSPEETKTNGLKNKAKDKADLSSFLEEDEEEDEENVDLTGAKKSGLKNKKKKKEEKPNLDLFKGDANKKGNVNDRQEEGEDAEDVNNLSGFEHIKQDELSKAGQRLNDRQEEGEDA